MRKKLFTISTKAIVSMALVVFVACDREDADLGLDYVDNDQLQFGQLEMTPIRTYTTTYDSVRSNSPTTGVGLVGGYTDPEFGRHDAKVVAHLIPSGVPQFGDNPVCDSAFLFIPYTASRVAWYGDTTAPFNIFVHTLSNYLDPDSNYYNNRDFAVDQEIANAIVPIRPLKDVLYTHTVVPRPFIKIPIDENFIQNVIFPLEGSSAFESSDNFIENIFGIALSSDASAEAIIGLLMPSNDTKLRMYFHNDDSQSEEYDLRIGAASEIVNVNSFDYSMASFDLDNQDVVNGEAVVYTQAMGGAALAIEIPFIKDYKDSNWLLNRAELLLPVREGSANGYRLPERMQIIRDDEEGRRLIFDYNPAAAGETAVGGRLTTGDLRDNNYRFVITRQLQRYLDSKDSAVRFLVVPEIGLPDQSRAVINGNLGTAEQAQLKLYYTKTQ